MTDFMAEYRRREAAQLAAAKEALPELVEKLRGAGVTKPVVITFYGGGDEGSIDNITNVPAHLSSEVEQWADNLLEGTGVDWYNNDGGNGEITIDVAAGTCHYVVNQNETVSNEVRNETF